MRKAIVLVAALVSLAAACYAVFAMGGEYPRGETIQQPAWSEGLAELANRPDRVYGYWVNANDWLFYTGDTEALNQFLAQYAEIPERPLRVVLHPGQGRVKTSFSEARPETLFDWQLTILRWGTHPQAPELSGKPRSEPVAIIEVWLGGQVALEELKVPRRVEVVSGREIEAFVTAHEKAREIKESGDGR